MSRLAAIETEDGRTALCRVADDLGLHEGDQCLFDAERVTDYGCVARLFKDEREVPKAKPDGDVVRCATLMDHAKAKENAVMSKLARDTCAAKAEAAKLALRFVRVRYSFDRSALMITYVAEERPDVKDVARAIAADLRTRVNMTQIGVRDEAAAIGGLGPCGRELCCSTWLKGFDPVNVRMAKLQGLSLNPGAISGMCGRLKCCLRYEYDQYRRIERRMPSEGTCVTCPSGKGRVCGRHLLEEKIMVRLENDQVVECSPDDVQKMPRERGRRKQEKSS